MQSTVIGRIIPLAQELQRMGHAVVVLLHNEHADKGARTNRWNVPIAITGTNPFSRTAEGKRRNRGISLVLRMSVNALRAAMQLLMQRPSMIIISKPLPENTLAVLLAKSVLWRSKVILDSDDFELLANNLSSFAQRIAIHASERVAAFLASHIIVATPFLLDHMKQLTGGRKEVTLIPTGISMERQSQSGNASSAMLYIGSVSVSSGHRVDMLPDILLLVRKEVPDTTLIIAGSGDDEHALRTAFKQKGLGASVQWTGRFDAAEAASIAQKAAVLVDPIDASIENRAKSSFRAALALACSKPIVTSNIGIRTMMLPESLHERFFAVPDDTASYAQHIVSLLKTPLSELERSALLERANAYRWPHLAKQYSHALGI